MVSFFTPFPFIVLTSYFILLILQFSLDSLEFLWVVIELLTFVLIGLVFITSFSSNAMTGAVVYFITQSILSIIFLSLVFFIRFTHSFSFFIHVLFFLVIFINMGGFPFHSWYYTSVYSFSNILFLIVLTVHNTPLLLSFSITFYSFACTIFQQFLLFVVITNLLFLGVFSLISSDLRSLILTTSLANNTWLVLSCFTSSFVMVIYVFVYFVLVYMVLFLKPNISLWALLSLSGLPPFPIFFINLLIFLLVLSNFSFISSFLYSCVIILFTLLVSISYLRFVFSFIILK